jgi:hypothetical protein
MKESLRLRPYRSGSSVARADSQWRDARVSRLEGFELLPEIDRRRLGAHAVVGLVDLAALFHALEAIRLRLPGDVLADDARCRTALAMDDVRPDRIHRSDWRAGTGGRSLLGGGHSIATGEKRRRAESRESQGGCEVRCNP